MTWVFTIRKPSDAVSLLPQERPAGKGRRAEAEERGMTTCTCLPRRDAAWWHALVRRAHPRTAQQLDVESVKLITEGRDAR
jgi:hypothetical protein